MCIRDSGGSRRPFRWWKARACIEENNAWGKRRQTLNARIALAVSDEKNVLVQSVLEEKVRCVMWDPVVAETKKGERLERKTAQAAAKIERMRQEEEGHRCRVLADRKRFELHEALLRVGSSPGGRTFIDDWAFWHGFAPDAVVEACANSTRAHGQIAQFNKRKCCGVLKILNCLVRRRVVMC